jgi:hypothetical protein
MTTARYNELLLLQVKFVSMRMPFPETLKKEMSAELTNIKKHISILKVQKDPISEYDRFQNILD